MMSNQKLIPQEIEDFFSTNPTSKLSPDGQKEVINFLLEEASKQRPPLVVQAKQANEPIDLPLEALPPQEKQPWWKNLEVILRGLQTWTAYSLILAFIVISPFAYLELVKECQDDKECLKKICPEGENDCCEAVCKHGKCTNSGGCGSGGCEGEPCKEDCSNKGLCACEESDFGTSCYAATQQGCKKSKECKSHGRCTLHGKLCRAGSQSDCKQSDLCKKEGKCRYESKPRQCVLGKKKIDSQSTQTITLTSKSTRQSVPYGSELEFRWKAIPLAFQAKRFMIKICRTNKLDASKSGECYIDQTSCMNGSSPLCELDPNKIDPSQGKFYKVKNLPEGKWYWQVAVIGANEKAGWIWSTAIGEFTISTPAPVIVEPQNGSTFYENEAITFSWKKDSRFKRCKIKFCSNNTMTKSCLTAKILTEASKSSSIFRCINSLSEPVCELPSGTFHYTINLQTNPTLKSTFTSKDWHWRVVCADTNDQWGLTWNARPPRSFQVLSLACQPNNTKCSSDGMTLFTCYGNGTWNLGIKCAEGCGVDTIGKARCCRKPPATASIICDPQKQNLMEWKCSKWEHKEKCKNGCYHRKCCQPTSNPKEVCDGIDNDCDGTIDSFYEPCYDGPPSTRNVGRCKDGKKYCGFKKFGPCVGQSKPSSSDNTCDGVDDDCNGIIDDGCKNRD